MRVVLVAEEAAGVQALRTIAASGAALVAVLTSSTDSRGVTVAALARKLGFPVWPGELVGERGLADRLRAADVDLLINVHSLHRIHEQVVDAPRLGSFNLHPGPLPGYAGLNAPSWAIYLGEGHHAVTLHRMTGGIDTGAVAYAAPFPLDDCATGLSVSTRCVKLGVPLIERLLTDASASPAHIPSTPQDPRLRRVFRRRDLPHGGRVRWETPAAEIARWVRASDFHPLPSPWGYPVTYLGERELRLAQAAPGSAALMDEIDADPGTVVAVDADRVAVATGAGLLMVRTLTIDGARVNAAERLRAGMQFH